MNASNFILKRPRLFYGWWLVVAGFIIIAYGDGIRRFLSRQLLTIARDEFNVSITQASLIISVSGFAGSVALLAAGPLIDRWGPRRMMLIGIPMAGIGYIGLSFAQGVIGLSIINGALVGLGMTAGFLLPVQTVAANWFNRRRSLALAIVSAASVIGGAIVIFLEQFIAGAFPWRGTFQVLGLVMLLIGVPLALIIRHRPEPHGYLPDGDLVPGTSEENTDNARGSEDVEVNFTLTQTLRARSFWILAGAMGLASWLTVVSIFRFSLLADRGISPHIIGLSSSITPFMGLLGILAFGFLGDRYSKRHLLALAVAIQSLSVLLLLVGGVTFQIIVFPLAFGLGSGTIPIILAIRADYFGRKSFATITVAATVATGIMGSPVALLASASTGWLHDVIGSFIPGLLLSLPVGLAASILFLYARPPSPPPAMVTLALPDDT